MSRHLALLTCILLTSASLVALETVSGGDKADWAATIKLPAEEKAVKLFNGKDFTGWEGQIEKFWSVDNGMIKATNKGAVPVSTYLFTTKNYRDFRLLLEIKQTRGKDLSTMHSAVALLGEKFLAQGDPYSFKGPLMLLCDDWGFYEVNGRKRIVPAGQKGVWKHPAEKFGDWNQIEILVKGNHVRCVANGQSVVDFTEKEGVFKGSPIGLQLHQNNQHQEYWFRGLILAENPQDRLLTLPESKK